MYTKKKKKMGVWVGPRGNAATPPPPPQNKNKKINCPGSALAIR